MGRLSDQGEELLVVEEVEGGEGSTVLGQDRSDAILHFIQIMGDLS